MICHKIKASEQELRTASESKHTGPFNLQTHTYSKDTFCYTSVYSRSGIKVGILWTAASLKTRSS